MGKKRKRSDPEPAPDDDGPAAEQTLDDLRRKAEEADELREQVLRLRADHANTLKRQARDAEAFRRYAITAFVETLLPGLDDLKRALDSAAETQDVETLRHGVVLAFENLRKALRDAGVEPVDSVGKPFDPAVHEAVVVEAAPAVETPTVAEEIRAGYVMGDRVVRPAQVKVAMPPPREDAGRDAEPPEGSERDEHEPEPGAEERND